MLNNELVIKKASEKLETVLSFKNVIAENKRNNRLNRIIRETAENIEDIIEEFKARKINNKCIEKTLIHLDRMTELYIIETYLKETLVGSILSKSVLVNITNNYNTHVIKLDLSNNTVEIKLRENIRDYKKDVIYTFNIIEFLELEKEFKNNNF